MPRIGKIQSGLKKYGYGIEVTEVMDQQKFYDHHIFVITDNDSTIGTTQGQRNTGSSKYTVMIQVLVCATAVDTIRPNDAAVYRAWDTPIHEFGHSIHEVLDILDTFIALEAANNSNYDENLKNELGLGKEVLLLKDTTELLKVALLEQADLFLMPSVFNT